MERVYKMTKDQEQAILKLFHDLGKDPGFLELLEEAEKRGIDRDLANRVLRRHEKIDGQAVSAELILKTQKGYRIASKEKVALSKSDGNFCKTVYKCASKLRDNTLVGRLTMRFAKSLRAGLVGFRNEYKMQKFIEEPDRAQRESR